MSDARRYRIHALTDLAALNHRLDVARKERERIESVLKATQREVVDAASKGTQPSPETMRTLTEFSTRDGVSFAEVVGAQYDHGDKAPALRAELDRAHEDPAGTYDDVVVALTRIPRAPTTPSWRRSRSATARLTSRVRGRARTVAQRTGRSKHGPPTPRGGASLGRPSASSKRSVGACSCSATVAATG
mgnify:CR=1 FL=1